MIAQTFDNEWAFTHTFTPSLGHVLLSHNGHSTKNILHKLATLATIQINDVLRREVEARIS